MNPKQTKTHPGTIAEPDPSIPEVHALLSHHVTPVALLVRLATEVMLPGNVSQDGMGLCQLDISCQKKSDRNLK